MRDALWQEVSQGKKFYLVYLFPSSSFFSLNLQVAVYGETAGDRRGESCGAEEEFGIYSFFA